MKKVGIFVSLLVLLAVFPLSVSAQKDIAKTGDRVVVPETEVIDHDFFAAGQVVEIYGTINGDAYIAGGQLIINGTINGDLLAVGGQITVDSLISQNARLIGGQISLDGSIGRNLTLAGGDANLGKDLTIAQNLVAGVGNLRSSALIQGDATFGAGNALIDNQIAGDIKAGVGLLRLGPNANVSGDLTYWSREDIVLSGDATISGTLTKNLPPASFPQDGDLKFTQHLQAGIQQFVTIHRLMCMLSAIIIGYILVHFFPNISYRLINTIEDRPGASFFVGLAALILTPIIGFILFIPFITIPLAIGIIMVFALATYIARILFMYWLGARLLDRLGRTADKTVTLFIGIGLYYLLSAFIIIGPIISIAAIVFSLGALLLTCQRSYLSGRKLKIF